LLARLRAATSFQYAQEWNLRKLRGQLGLAKGGGKRRSVKPW